VNDGVRRSDRTANRTCWWKTSSIDVPQVKTITLRQHRFSDRLERQTGSRDRRRPLFRRTISRM